MTRRHTCAVLLLCALALPRAARSQPATEEAKERAKALVSDALAAFEAKRFDEAGRLYLEAYEFANQNGLGAKPELLYNAGLAFEETPACDLVADLFVRFLVAAPESASSADFVERLERARACAPEVSITSTPPGATVSMDGRERGVTPFRTHLKTGEHTLELSLGGYRTIHETISVVQGAPAAVSRVLESDRPSAERRTSIPDLDSRTESAKAPAGENDLESWMWLSGGTGAIATIVGAALVGLEIGATRRARNAEERQDIEEYSRSRKTALGFAIGARTSFGVAGAGALTMALLSLLGDSDPGLPRTPASSSAARGDHPRIIPGLGPSGFVLRFEIR